MNVLFVYNVSNNADNPFVRTLIKGLVEIGVNISWGLNSFWHYKTNYDVIHIQWPESIFNWRIPSDLELVFLEKHFAGIKIKSKIVYTRHNQLPNYNSDPNVLKLYDLVESNSDAIVDLGHSLTSANLNRLKINNYKHFIIYHHIYDSEYNNGLTQVEARMKLNIPEYKFVILTFGNYRDNEERKMVLEAYNNLKIKNKFLLAPRLYKKNTVSNIFSIKWINSKLKLIIYKLKNIRIEYTNFIADKDLPYYFAAADVVLIQRKRILNSGNVPMAFYFKKVVICPNIGNVAELAKATGNPVFDSEDIFSICQAIENAKKLNEKDLGLKNYQYALKNMNINKIARSYLAVYQSICSLH